MNRWVGLVLIGFGLLGLVGCGKAAQVPPESEWSMEADINRLEPAQPASHEQIAAAAKDLCAAAQDSCRRMLELAAEGADPALAEEAQQTADLYTPRLAELAEMDYIPLTDPEIYTYMEEVSNIITAFREMRDKLNGLA